MARGGTGPTPRPGIAEHDVGVLLAKPDDTEALRAVRDWYASSEWAILLLGRPGNGKTCAASWAVAQEPSTGASDAVHHHGDVWTWCAERQPRLLKARALERWSRFDEKIWTALEEHAVLALDELGGEGDWLASVIDGVVDARYSAGRKTLLTSNLSAAGFKERFGERVADRLRERARVVVCTGPSLRGRAAASQTGRAGEP